MIIKTGIQMRLFGITLVLIFLTFPIYAEQKFEQGRVLPDL